MGSIFINYRRGESIREAQHLATLFAKPFGARRVFLDVRGLDGGTNWLQTLERQVAGSDIMVALIGKDWINLKDEQGNRRLDNADDFVRFEITQALQRQIPVLPVLLDGARMPKANELPANMMALTLFQSMPLRIESIVADADAISKRLRIMLAGRRRRSIPWWAAGLIASAVLVSGVLLGLLLVQLGSPTIAGLFSGHQPVKTNADNAPPPSNPSDDPVKTVDELVARAKKDLEQAEQIRDKVKVALTKTPVKNVKTIDCTQIGIKYDNLFVDANKRVQEIVGAYKALPSVATELEKAPVRLRFCAVGGELVGFYKFVQTLANDCASQGENMESLLKVINEQLGLAQKGVKEPCG